MLLLLFLLSLSFHTLYCCCCIIAAAAIAAVYRTRCMYGGATYNMYLRFFAGGELFCYRVSLMYGDRDRFEAVRI